MDPKVASILEKARQEKARGNTDKALKRLTDAADKYPAVVELYLDAADTYIDLGESLDAIQLLKKARSRAGGHKPEITDFCLQRVQATNDPVLAKFVLEESLKAREVDTAQACVDALDDRAARELLQRARTKQRTLDSAVHGGYSLMKERVVNAMSEAMLCVRLGKLKEAVKYFVRLLDERELEREAIKELFEMMVQAHPDSSRVRFGLACALLYTDTKRDRAIAELVEAVKLDRSIAGDCLTRLRVFETRSGEVPAAHTKGLALILLANGDVTRAAEVLSEFAAGDRDQMPVVLGIVEAHLDDVRASSALAELYMSAALACDEPARALALANSTTDADTLDAIYDWLNQYGRHEQLPDGLALYLGERALARGEVEHGLEILKTLAAASESQVPAVTKLLEAHRASDPRIAAALDVQRPPETTEASDAVEEPTGRTAEVEIECIEPNEFTFSADSPLEALADDAPSEDETGATGLDVDRGFSGFEGSAPLEPAKPEEKPRRTHRFQPREFVWMDDNAVESDDAVTEEPVPPVDEGFIDSLADAMRASGNAMFFRENPEDNSFARARRKIDAHIDGGRYPAARAELETLSGNGDGEDAREWILRRLCDCQRAMKDYEAAKDTLEALRELRPDCEDVRALARRNYADYLADQCEDTPVLERITSIEKD